MDPEKLYAAFGLGTWLGRKQAFGLVAGKCSAADAECLRQMRDSKEYRALGLSWDQFCRQHAGMSRVAADKIIHLLEKHGPKYFELSAVVRITPEEYGRIAASISDSGLSHNGQTIEIAVQNAPQLCAAVDELRKETAPPPKVEAPDPDRPFKDALRAWGDANELFRKLTPELRLRLANELPAAGAALHHAIESWVVNDFLKKTCLR